MIEAASTDERPTLTRSDGLNATISSAHQPPIGPRCVSARGNSNRAPFGSSSRAGLLRSGLSRGRRGRLPEYGSPQVMKSGRHRELFRSDLSSGPLGRWTSARAVLWLHPSCECALAMFEAVGAAPDRRLAAKELRPVQQPAKRPAATPRLQVDQRDLAASMHLHLIDSLPAAMMDQIAEARVESFDQWPQA